MPRKAFYFTLIILSIAAIGFAQQPVHKKTAKKPEAKASTTPKSADSTISAGPSDSTKVVKTKKPVEAKKKGPEKDTLHVSIEDVINTLHNGTGWVKNDFGKWVSSPNRIPFEDPDLNNEYYSRYEIGKDNFQEMDLMPVSFQGKKYYSLAVRYMKAINEEQKDKTKEWKCYPAVEYYIIPKDEIKKLRTLGPIRENTKVNLKFIYFGSYFCFNQGQFVDKMKKRIEWNITNDHPDDSSVECYFQISLSPKKTKTGTILRLNYSLTYPARDAEPAEPDYTLFDEQYYEIPVANWQAFVGGK